MTTAKISPFGHVQEVSPGIVRVTFSLKRRSAAPGYIRARVALAGHFDTLCTRLTNPRIVAQVAGEWMTWESRLLDASEPDSPLRIDNPR